MTCACCAGFFDAAGGVLAPGTALRCHHDHSRHRVASKATRQQQETPVADSPSNRGSNLGPSRPADDLVADLACLRTAVSQESFWQIGFDDTVTNSMVEMSHQGLLPRHLLAAAARLSHSPLHRGRHACQGLLCVSDMKTDRRRVRLCGTYVRYRPKLAVSTVLHGLVGPRGVAEQGRARQL